MIPFILLVALASAAQAAPGKDDFFLIHGFDGQDYANRLGGTTGKWEINPTDTSQWCNLSFVPYDSRFMEQGYALKVDYKVGSSKENFVTQEQGVSQQEVGFHGRTANGIFTLLKGFDASPYRFLSFRIKGDAEAGYTKSFKLELKDKNRTAQVIVEGITDRWQLIEIPLSKFQDRVQISELTEYVIVFDQKVTRQQGVLYLDEIGFSKEKSKPVAPGGNESVKVPEVSVRRLLGAVKIDGNLDEWEGECFHLGKSNLEFGDFKGESKGSADICLGWDSVYLYAAAKVRDNEIISRFSGAEIYRMDGVELFVDPKNDGYEWKNPSDIQLGLAPSGPEGTPQAWSYFSGSKPADREVKIASVMKKKGYDIEAAISLEFLGVNPAEGEKFGFSAALHDLDSSPPGENKLNWRFIKEPGNPGKFLLGRARLAK
ncbi:MAG: hypothetical protein A2901_04685 [Elusimicrobia bacterium RIFCSPLOWO2_01_FULL_54_10]|nr:MAG: hypothetical protein A2901_04685 [Elusimicrobia bacterium RIFCSPLOWO2_01_FULL_54_10]